MPQRIEARPLRQLGGFGRVAHQLVPVGMCPRLAIWPRQQRRIGKLALRQTLVGLGRPASAAVVVFAVVASAFAMYELLIPNVEPAVTLLENVAAPEVAIVNCVTLDV